MLSAALKKVFIASFSQLHVGDFFEEWNESAPQTHIRKFEEHTA